MSNFYTKKILFGFLTSILVLSLIAPQKIRADDLIIEGNGSGSSNEVNITSTNQTEATQENTANITNNIEISADTGDNTASDNTGDTLIATGDISSNTNIENSTNFSSVIVECCPGTNELNSIISGNGSDSTNSISGGVVSTTNVTVNQTADIYNVVTGTGNTGFNTASGNFGNVSITTGNIKVSDLVKNSQINVSDIKAPIGTNMDIVVKIFGNGTGSTNEVNLDIYNDFAALINNLAKLDNIINWDLNTGGNKASDNLADVSIITGNIFLETTIENDGINVSKIIAECCPKEVVPPAGGPNPPPPLPCETNCNPCTSNCNPSSPCSSNCSPTSGGSSGGEVLGSSTGEILPATGTPWILILTLLSLLMFLSGLYLRRHPGNDPGK